MAYQTEIAIIGGGIVGLATGLELTRRFPEVRLVRHRKGIIRRGSPDKPQQRRDSLRNLLQAREFEGQALR